ncbi:MAG: ATP-binding cassette domain-containing protein [Rhodopseudomonas sp.]|nr:ATP-binding cassette domain-containing protein [Rhodopseudomonas sp.]
MAVTTPARDAIDSRGDAIRLERVDKWYGTRDQPVHALDTTDLTVSKGDFVVLLGPSGCGKTTLLRMIGGLIAPSHGLLKVMDRDLWKGDARQSEAVKSLGIVFQEANLFPWLTIEQNIALPLELRQVPKAERAARVRELTSLVGIAGFEQRWPRELSGGMRQRAAIARALSYGPDILLMDEPFGALDAMTRDAMNIELQNLWMKTGKTIVLVTHSIAEAVFLADRIILLSPRPGRIDTVLNVPFARPRVIDTQSSAEFQAIVRDLRHRLDQIS